MQQPLVLIDTELPSAIAEMLQPVCQLGEWEDTSRRAEVAGLFVYGHPTIDGELLDLFPALKVVSNFGVGVDHIHVEAAEARGVPVGNTPGVLDGATADLTMALLLAAARNLIVGDRYARSPEFRHFDPNILHGAEVHGSTLGIIGMGRIGRQVAQRARGFDMRVLYHNRNRDREAEKSLGAEYAALVELLSRSHFVALTVPLTDETHHLIGARELELMRPEAILINTARGGVVDHQALVDALRRHVIRGAALDVTDPEPLPRDHPLLGLDNLVIAPHLGSATDRTRHRMAERAVENLRLGLAGKKLAFEVTS